MGRKGRGGECANTMTHPGIKLGKGTMEPTNGSIWNDEVQVGKWRKIAARGITPNHKGGMIRFGEVEGELWYFEHFNDTTVLSLRQEGKTYLEEFDLKHLDEIEFSS